MQAVTTSISHDVLLSLCISLHHQCVIVCSSHTKVPLQNDHQKPDGHTFVSLLHACRQARDQSLARKVYKNALDAGCTQSLMIYDAAISACQSPVDLDTAVQVYADMQR